MIKNGNLNRLMFNAAILSLFLVISVSIQTSNSNSSNGGLQQFGVQIDGLKAIINADSPTIGNITHSPTNPTDRDKVTVTAVVTASTGVDRVMLRYRETIFYGAFYAANLNRGVYEWAWFPFFVEADWKEIQMALVADTSDVYKAELLELPYRSKVVFQVRAYDSEGGVAVSDVYEYTVGYGLVNVIYNFLTTTISYGIYIFIALYLFRATGREKKKTKEESEK